jgi:hypothetical protein
MSLRDVPTGTMINVSSDWLDPEGARPLIEAIAPAAALLPSIKEAHQRVIKTQARPDQGNDELAKIQEEQGEVDVRHDRKGRGLYGALTAFAEIADDLEEAASYLALRDKIYPPERGLRILQASYGEEAGEADLVEERLDDADRALLKKLPAPGGKLSDVHKARITAARKLGSLEKKRKHIEAQAAEPGEGTIKPADVLRARNGWIQAARALIAVLDLARPNEKALERILLPLDEAERKASRSGKGRGILEEEPDDAPAGETDPPK